MYNDGTCEHGEAALLAAAFAIIVLAALALPAYECGRMLNDKTLAAAAAADAACALSASPDVSITELEQCLHDTYPSMADALALEVVVNDSNPIEYDDKAYDPERGEYCSFPRTVISRQVTTKVSVTRPFITNAAMFLSVTFGGTDSYTVSARGISVIDDTVASGGW